MVKKFLRISTVVVTLVFAVLLLKAFFWVIPPAQAEAPALPPPVEQVHDWVIVTALINPGDDAPTRTNGLFIVDPTTDIAYGPFLTATEDSRPLGSDGGGIFDVSVTPDGKTAIVSNFGDSTIYYIDVSDPLHPSNIVSHTISFFAEDTSITYDGKFGLVTDGGFTTKVVVLDMINHTPVYTMENTIKNGQFQSVDAGPDGTIVSADYSNMRVNASVLSPTGYLTVTNVYTLDYFTHTILSVNAYIAPDGKTVLVPGVSSSGPLINGKPNYTDTVSIYKILSPGVLTPTGVISGLRGGQQSIAFNGAGDKAYVLSNAYSEVHSQTISTLNILGPGEVEFDASSPISIPHRGTSQLFGVETIAAVGSKVYLGNPTLSGAQDTELNVIDMQARSVYTIPNTYLSVGVGVIHPPRPLVVGKDGSGEGKVTNLPAGVDCGETCTTLVNYRRSITLTAEAGPYSAFSGWSGACEGTGTCTVLVTGTTQVTATFVASDLNLSMTANPDPVLVGNPVRYTLVVSNPGPAPAPDLVVTDTLPAGTTFLASESDAACAGVGRAVTCTVLILTPGSQANLNIAADVPASTADGTLLTNAGGIVPYWSEPNPENSHAQVTAQAAIKLLYYQLGEKPGWEWNVRNTTNSPSGKVLLGRFSNGQITLSLPDLLNHAGAILTFDLAIIGSMEGNATVTMTGGLPSPAVGAQSPEALGPDIWSLAADNRVLQNTTFSNLDVLGFRQAFPFWYPGGDFPARQGAAENNTLGYTVNGVPMDSTYDLFFVFQHQSPTLRLDFNGKGMQDVSVGSWALSNLKVYLLGRVPGLYMPYVVK